MGYLSPFQHEFREIKAALLKLLFKFNKILSIFEGSVFGFF